MIRVRGVLTPSTTPAASVVRLEGRHSIVMPVGNLERSIRFYRRVFGLHATVGSDGRVGRIEVTPNVELVLDADTGSGERRSIQPACMFLVTDLDIVREQVWELGVEVARDSGAPDHIYREANTRSLYVGDPDGNLLKLVEAPMRLVIPTSAPGIAARAGSRTPFARRSRPLSQGLCCRDGARRDGQVEAGRHS